MLGKGTKVQQQRWQQASQMDVDLNSELPERVHAPPWHGIGGAWGISNIRGFTGSPCSNSQNLIYHSTGLTTLSCDLQFLLSPTPATALSPAQP